MGSDFLNWVVCELGAEHRGLWDAVVDAFPPAFHWRSLLVQRLELKRELFLSEGKPRHRRGGGDAQFKPLMPL